MSGIQVLRPPLLLPSKEFKTTTGLQTYVQAKKSNCHHRFVVTPSWPKDSPRPPHPHLGKIVTITSTPAIDPKRNKRRSCIASRGCLATVLLVVQTNHFIHYEAIIPKMQHTCGCANLLPQGHSFSTMIGL